MRRSRTLSHNELEVTLGAFLSRSSVMNAPFGAYPSAYISFSGQFTSRVVPIVLRCIVTRPLFISTIAPIVPMSLLSCTLLFSLVFPRP